jgi:hypothetical protein
MDISIFTDKNRKPEEDELEKSLGNTYPVWQKIIQYIFSVYPYSQNEWNYPGGKYGWSFRIKDKKRAIIYLLPRDGFFKVAIVFGPKATDMVMKSDVSESIKSELTAAKAYAEGRGIRIDVRDETVVKDIIKLINIKIST